ncbi:hypothetical protein COLO4_23118 [Corchorus olitorius]|uniref:BHLH domain-containing protein n=1 Tax=Corchorus olitorius TaxID=93759 RepID=A0A1R3II96_9ROSI|nr:hypothetical protein COLO4_23118 [Corchorus olitorius]
MAAEAPESIPQANFASTSDIPEFSELVWENGQILFRGLSSKITNYKRSTTRFPGYNFSQSNFNFKDIVQREGEMSTANDNRSKDGVQESTFGDPISGLTKLDLNHDKSKMNSYPQANYAELLSEFYEDDFSVKQLIDSHVVPAVNKFNSFKQSDDDGSRKLVEEMPHLMNSDHEVPDDHHHHHSSLKQCEVSVPFMRSNSGVEEKRDRVNFSMFLRSGATTRPRSAQQVRALAETGDQDIFERNIVRSEQGNLMGNNTKPILIPDTHEPQKETLPDEQSEAVGYNQDISPNSRSSKGNIPCDGKLVEQMVGSSSVCSRGASNCPTYTLKTRYDQDTDLSENATEEPEGTTSTKAPPPPRGSKGAKKKRKAEVHNLSERKRRDKINKKMRALQELIPNCNKVDKASMLDEAIEYLKTLQFQVQMMSMGSGFFMPPNPMMLHAAMQQMNAQNMIGPYSPMGVGMAGMGMGMGMGFPSLPGIREARLNSMIGFPGQVPLMSMLSPSPFTARFCPQSVQAPAPAMQMQVEQQFPVPGVAANAIPLSTSKDSNTTCQ